MHTQKLTWGCEENKDRRQAFPESCKGNILSELPVIMLNDFEMCSLVLNIAHGATPARSGFAVNIIGVSSYVYMKS